jgi:two-component system, NarL family, response regulator DevR
MIRAVIIEDQPDLADALRETVEFGGATDVVAVCHTLGVSADVIARLQPDIVVTDFRLPDGDAVDQFARWRSSVPECRILVVSAWSDERSIRRAREAGAQGYLEKGPELEVLPEAIASIAAGGTRWLDVPDDETVGAPTALDPTALEVLAALRAGTATSAIAATLGLSEFAVRQHVNTLLRAYGARTRRDLVALAGVAR